MLYPAARRRMAIVNGSTVACAIQEDDIEICIDLSALLRRYLNARFPSYVSPTKEYRSF